MNDKMQRGKKEGEKRKKCTYKENSNTCTEDTAAEPAHALVWCFTALQLMNMFVH
jgi:hypothetical protein